MFPFTIIFLRSVVCFLLSFVLLRFPDLRALFLTELSSNCYIRFMSVLVAMLPFLASRVDSYMTFFRCHFVSPQFLSIGLYILPNHASFLMIGLWYIGVVSCFVGTIRTVMS